MREIVGKYENAKIFTDNVEDEAVAQIQQFLDLPMAEGTNVRVMPDCHAGAGCVIGFTAKLTDKVVPNLIGVDISCGVTSYNISNYTLNLPLLDTFVRRNIPNGRNVYTHPQQILSSDLAVIEEVCKMTGQDVKYVLASIGTLGGGNHFLEMNKGSDGSYWLTVHSGSRNFGLKIANHFQDIAKNSQYSENRARQIAELKKMYSSYELGQAIAGLPKQLSVTGMEYIEGQNLSDYIYASTVADRFAKLSRKSMLDKIVAYMGLTVNDIHATVESVHNYIDFDRGIIRKGAIDASEGKKVIIPLNMRDGSVIGVGKGNADWNYSAPHGAGRAMSRTKAKASISMADYTTAMEDVYSTSVVVGTLDEAPFAYKPSEEIIRYLEPTVDVLEVIKPIWNFKAKE